jgi:hypothetical protein
MFPLLTSSDIKLKIFVFCKGIVGLGVVKVDVQMRVLYV